MENEHEEKDDGDDDRENNAPIVQFRVNFSPTNDVNGINEEIKCHPKRSPNRQPCKILVGPPFFNWFWIQNVLKKAKLFSDLKSRNCGLLLPLLYLRQPNQYEQ